MRTVDQITSFLNNEMTPAQEREFLLSVAASDSMRLSLKSHVMLDRIFTAQLERAHVPDGVRNAIFAEMSASMAQPVPAPTVSASPTAFAQHARAVHLGSRLYARLASKAGWTLLVVLLTLGGFTVGYYIGTGLSEMKRPEATKVVLPDTPRDMHREALAPSSSLSNPSPIKSVADEVPGSTSIALSAPAKHTADRTDVQLKRTAVTGRKSAQSSVAQSAHFPSVDIPAPELPALDSESANGVNALIVDPQSTDSKSFRNGETVRDGGTKFEIYLKTRKPNDSDRSNQGVP